MVWGGPDVPAGAQAPLETNQVIGLNRRCHYAVCASSARRCVYCSVRSCLAYGAIDQTSATSES